MATVMQIGAVTRMIVGQYRVSAGFLAIPQFLEVQKSNMLYPDQVLKLNIEVLPMLHLSYFGFNHC